MVYNSFSFSLIIREAESFSSCEEQRIRRHVGRNAVEILQCKSTLTEKERASNMQSLLFGAEMLSSCACRERKANELVSYGGSVCWGTLKSKTAEEIFLSILG